jgi:hypothetical protein
VTVVVSEFCHYRHVLRESKEMKLGTSTALDNILITGLVLTNV